MNRVLDKRQRTYLLVVVALALMMVVSAVSGLNVALPELARSTGATQTQLTWIVDAYTVVFAGLLLLIGAVGDRFGRKGVLLASLATFGLAALGASLVSDPNVLIVLRALMGVGAAATMPVTLSIITTTFPPEERGKAVGVWAGMAGAGAVLGLFGSGLLLQYFPWNSFFVLNVVLAVLAFTGTVWIVPASRQADPEPLDVVGGLLSLALVGGLVFAIIEGPEAGWMSGKTIAGFVIGAAAAFGFARWELAATAPLLDVRLFARRGFSVGAFNLAVQFFCSFGFFYVSLQYLQAVVGQSPLRAAVSLAPMPFVLIPLARIAPKIADRIGINRTGGAGLALMAIGLGIMSTIGVDLSYPRFAVGLALFAAGMGLSGTPATTAIVNSLPESKQGVASAMNDVSREFGSALGIAILGSILNSSYRHAIAPVTEGLPEPLRLSASHSVAFLQRIPRNALGPNAQHVIDGAKHAFLDGVTTALLTAAGICAVASLVVFALAPRRDMEQDGNDTEPHATTTDQNAALPRTANA
jgi:EmrB/QacA subfamily drug resistance transporter